MQLAEHARGTPRNLLRLVRRAVRYARSRGLLHVDSQTAAESLAWMGYTAEGLTAENGTTLLGLAQGAEDVDLRFAAIRAVNALPAGIKPPGTEGLTLTTLEVRAKAGMKYDKELLTVTAGRPVELTLINPDTMEHNLVITLPGQAQAIGIAMSSDPTAAAAMGYVPKDDPAVLHYTGMLKPGQSQTLRFIAPTKPGRYEYVCTYPGHSASMNGVLEVVAP